MQTPKQTRKRGLSKIPRNSLEGWPVYTPPTTTERCWWLRLSSRSVTRPYLLRCVRSRLSAISIDLRSDQDFWLKLRLRLIRKPSFNSNAKQSLIGIVNWKESHKWKRLVRNLIGLKDINTNMLRQENEQSWNCAKANWGSAFTKFLFFVVLNRDILTHSSINRPHHLWRFLEYLNNFKNSLLASSLERHTKLAKHAGLSSWY